MCAICHGRLINECVSFWVKHFPPGCSDLILPWMAFPSLQWHCSVFNAPLCVISFSKGSGKTPGALPPWEAQAEGWRQLNVSAGPWCPRLRGQRKAQNAWLGGGWMGLGGMGGESLGATVCARLCLFHTCRSSYFYENSLEDYGNRHGRVLCPNTGTLETCVAELATWSKNIPLDTNIPS